MDIQDLIAYRKQCIALALSGLPPITTQAANFTKAVVAHVANGMIERTDEEQARILEICKGCPNFLEDGSRCKLCGCFLKLAVKWDSKHCPLNPPLW